MSTPYDPNDPERPTGGDPGAVDPQYGERPYREEIYGEPQFAMPQFADPLEPPPDGYVPGQEPVPLYAGWWTRVLARIIDWLIIVPVYLVAAIVLNTMTDDGDNPTSTAWVLFFAFIAIAIAVDGWNRWFRMGRTGQSLGKSALGVYLIEEATSRPPGALKTFVREICHILDWICYIGYIVCAFHPKRQTFADMIMRTVVVPEERYELS